MPELSQPEEAQEVSFDSLYNEVFGEGYDLVPFETFFNDVTDKVFDVASEYKIQFMQLSEDGFKLYADCVGPDTTNHRLAEAIYKASFLSIILEYSELSQRIGDSNFKDYLKNVCSTGDQVDNSDIDQVKAMLQEYKTKADDIDMIRDFTRKSSFNISTLINNTTADINFDDYAKEYTPEGATPVACYVGDMGPKGLNNTFGTGYAQYLDFLVVYIDSESKLNIKKGAVIVPWYTNSTDDYSYSLALGEEGKDYVYVKEDEELTIIEDPIISSELLPNETSREF